MREQFLNGTSAQYRNFITTKAGMRVENSEYKNKTKK